MHKQAQCIIAIYHAIFETIMKNLINFYQLFLTTNFYISKLGWNFGTKFLLKLLKSLFTCISKIWCQNFNPIPRYKNLHVEKIGKIYCKFWVLLICEQIEIHGNKFIMRKERWKTVYLVWLYQVRFSGYPNFYFFNFGRLPSLNRMWYLRKNPTIHIH